MDKSIGALTCQGTDPPTNSSAPQQESSTPKKTEQPSASKPDMDSEVCKECGTNLGASNCSADDNQCLVNQCKSDKKCTECKIDCDQYANL